MSNAFVDIDPVRVKTSIRLLKQNINVADISSLLVALDALSENPTDNRLFVQFTEAFYTLGVFQGAALTYAPYLSVLLSDDPFNNPS